MKQYYGGYTITCNWTCHRNRGSLGGIDRAMGVGTPIYACAAGTVSYIANNGTGGHTATIRHADGTKTQYMHLSQFVGAGRAVSEGELIGRSGGAKGAPGAGASTGPHLHAHSINTAGTRVPAFYESLGNSGLPSGGSTSTNWMGGGSATGWKNIQTWLSKNAGYTGVIDGDPKTLTWKSLQTYLKSRGWYSGVVDGVPGVLSWKAMQTWLQSNGYYSGVVDGVPGSLTAAGIDKLGAALVAPPAVVLKPNERKAKPIEVRRRTDPSTKNASIEPPIAANSVQAFDGWIRGEAVEGNNVWFVTGTSYFWSGGFTDTGTHDLTDKNTPVVLPEKRIAGTLEVRRRPKPTTAATAIDPAIPAGATATFVGYAKGLAVAGNDIWFHNTDGTWSWSGGFTSQSVTGLKLEEVEVPVVTLPANFVYGIDLAWPQSQTFDWDKVKEQNKFAIIKLGGAEDKAPNEIYGPANLADQHLAAVRAAGLRAGFYFFNNGKVNVKKQADKFVELLKTRIQPGDVIALDVEPSGDATQFTPDQALEFAGYMEAALGIKTFIYINRSTMNNQDWSKVVAAGHPLWLAVLDGLATSLTAPVKHWDKASIVQFEVGRIDGYPGDIDRNFAELAVFDTYGFQGFPESVDKAAIEASMKVIEAEVAKVRDLIK